MGTVYIEKEKEHAIIKHSEKDVTEFVNEAVKEKIENEGLNNE